MRPFHRRLLPRLTFAFLVLLGARVALTPLLERTVRQKVAAIAGHDVAFRELRLSLFSSPSITLDGVRIARAQAASSFVAERLEISLSWKTLWARDRSAKIRVVRPEWTEGQTPQWSALAAVFPPVRIEQVEIVDGTIRDPTGFAAIKALAARVAMPANAKGDSPSVSVYAKGIFWESGQFQGQFNRDRQDTWDSQIEVRGLAVDSLERGVSRWPGGFGSIDLTGSFRVKSGTLSSQVQTAIASPHPIADADTLGSLLVDRMAPAGLDLTIDWTEASDTGHRMQATVSTRQEYNAADFLIGTTTVVIAQGLSGGISRFQAPAESAMTFE